MSEQITKEPTFKSLGEICWDAFVDCPPKTTMTRPSWETESGVCKASFEAGARAVADAVLPKWRSVNEPPADVREVVLVGHRGALPVRTAFEFRSPEETHWMPMDVIPEVPEVVMSPSKRLASAIWDLTVRHESDACRSLKFLDLCEILEHILGSEEWRGGLGK